MKLEETVSTSVGEKQLDNTGSAIGAARMDPKQAYGAIPLLLKDYINNQSEDSWNEIRRRIDNTLNVISSALESLDEEAPFSQEIKRRITNGQKLFFKPNLVTLPLIDFRTHGPSSIGSCTPWEFIAALMRSFHDKLGISYHLMSLGEGGTNASLAAATASTLTGNTVTTLALFEGKSGDSYGGWGFYFVRKYLSESHDPSHTDDPMAGYQESLDGVCLPPGRVTNKLLLYDINKIASNGSDGREVPVAGGVNFKSITLHKAVIGGDPKKPRDIKDWPGCVLINVPKLKIHQLELLTCAVKNLGVGLYPMESNTGKNGKIQWQYARPNTPVPSFKVKVPHRRWAVDFDDKSGLPLMNKDGSYVMKRTGGMEATIADALKAVQGQGILMLHVADAIETSNIAHSGPGCVPVQEGFVFAATDPVALDEFCLHYLFNTVPLNETEKVRKENHLPSDVIQKTPGAEISGKDIVTGDVYDSPYTRYHALQHCEERGLGTREFHIKGKDLRHTGNLASLGHRLGHVESNTFSELITEATYFAEGSLLWYLQAGVMSYLRANDRLTGSSFERKILDAYDENGDGVIDFLEKGKSTLYGTMPYGALLGTLNIEPLEKIFKYRFLLGITPLRLQRKEWNPYGQNIGEDDMISNAIALAFIMSKTKIENPDPIFPERNWGKGKWPSLQFAIQRQLSRAVYGPRFPEVIDTMMTPYGQAFRYADTCWNEGRYCQPAAVNDNGDFVARYRAALTNGAPLLPFVFYVPEGFGGKEGLQIANVRETSDPHLVFTAVFNGQEVWNELDLTNIS